MNDEERIKKIREEAKKSAKELLEDVPEDIKDILRKEKTLGNPRNLSKPDDESE